METNLILGLLGVLPPTTPSLGFRLSTILIDGSGVTVSMTIRSISSASTLIELPQAPPG